MKRLIIFFSLFCVACSPEKNGLNLSSSSPQSSQPSLPAQPKLAPLQVGQLALLINDNDPYSVAVGEYYRVHRNVPDANILHLSIPTKIQLTRAEFSPIKAQIDAALTSEIQIIAIAWTNPSRVECNSITSAISRGFMSGPCDAGGTYPTCGFATNSPYYNSSSSRPFTDHGFRPSMMIAALSQQEAFALIDRGVASDGTHPKGQAHIMKTSDNTRSLRANMYSLSKLGYQLNSSVNIQKTVAENLISTTDTLFYFQGLAQVQNISTNHFPPGAVADHLTSFGGRLTDSGQMSALQFISGGVTGTFGTVSEPCAFTQKFPDPAIMISHYTAGETLIEAYWKSISQTFQGVFVGEPLANPWMEEPPPTP